MKNAKVMTNIFCSGECAKKSDLKVQGPSDWIQKPEVLRENVTTSDSEWISLPEENLLLVIFSFLNLKGLQD